MNTGTRENDDIQENWSAPPSPIQVLQQLSGEAVRMAGGAWQSAVNTPPILEPAPRHRRTRSEVATPFYRRSNSSNSFQKWKSHMQRALQWGSRSFRDDNNFSSFDPEILANQKRQWYQLHSTNMDPEKYKEPTSLFEHFVIVGIRPDANLDVVEDAFIRGKKWEQEMARPEASDTNMRQYRRPALPTLDPQVLFKYPPRKKSALRVKDLAAFCFPGGVQAHVLEKSPSYSELNELVYGQEHLSRDDFSFIFSLKVADNATLYGVCLHVRELVQKPSLMQGPGNLSQLHPRCRRFLVSAPRCYCILTRVPFFELHYEMLNSIIAQERLNRITRFVNEMSLSDYVPSPIKSKNHINENLNSPCGESVTDWMASAIPIDNVIALTAAAAGIISDEDVPSSSWDMYSPESVTTSDASDYTQMRDMDKESNKNIDAFQDCGSETPDSQTNDVEHTYKIHYDCNTPSPYIGPYVSQSSQSSESFQSLSPCLDPLLILDDITPKKNLNLPLMTHIQSLSSLMPPMRSKCLRIQKSEYTSLGENLAKQNLLFMETVIQYLMEDLQNSAGRMLLEEEDEISNEQNKDPREEVIMEWAKDNKNDLLQIVCGYHSMPLPARGNDIIFRPLEHLQPIEYQRLPVYALGLCDKYLDLKPKNSREATQMKLKLAAAEEAASLALWSTATICRVLSLENVLALFTAVLLEKQVVVLSPNLGVLSAVVLSIIPIIRPFEWQSLFLPVLPEKMLDFLDAPVPFIVGIQHKPSDLKMKTSNLFQVHVVNGQVGNCNLPALPQCKKLISELRPYHSTLSCEDSVAQMHPVYKCSEVQAEAAEQFLNVMRRYLESLCSDLRLHTITSVESNNDRVSILLKDSFIDSFPARDQSFIKLFVETQLFTILSDFRLSSYENEYI